MSSRQFLKQLPANKPGQPVPDYSVFESAPAFPKTIGDQPEGLPLHACMGLNACKGADRFGTAGHIVSEGTVGSDNITSQTNDCAGQGYCSTAVDHTCHVQNQCKDQGGCGLYGTGEEMNQPGTNDCRALGSCATPMNAERFSTNGPNRGKSVWLRAREVFKENWPQMRAKLIAQQEAGTIDKDRVFPEEIGDVPEPFSGIGPSYLWISDDNEDRNNMTACGSSGTSGAGGCS